MTVIMGDVVNSTRLLAEQGPSIVQGQIDARLEQMVAMLRSADPNLWLKPPAGDGQLCLGHADVVADLVQAAINVQLQKGLDLRIAMAVGEVIWRPKAMEGQPFPAADISGPVISLAERLKGVCTPGGLVLSNGCYQLLDDEPKLQALFIEQTGPLKDFPGPQIYWILALKPRRIVVDELSQQPATSATPGSADLFRMMHDVYDRAERREDKLIDAVQVSAEAQARIAAGLASLSKTVERIEKQQRQGFDQVLDKLGKKRRK